MINLLPSETKHSIRAARMNIILLQYNFLALVAVATVLGMCFGFYIYLSTLNLSAQSTTSDNDAKAVVYNDVRKEADEYRNNLSIAKKILDNDISYSSVVFAITKLLPEGVFLDSIDLSPNSFGQQTTFSAHAKSYELSSTLKERFENSDVFSNVYLQNVSQPSSGSGTSGSTYPVAITISAQLKKVQE